MIVAAWVWRGRRSEDDASLIWFLFSATLLLAPDMIALGWTAMWMAMSGPKGRSNAGRAVFGVCVAPYMIICAIYATLDGLGIIRRPISPWIPWIIVGLMIDIGLCGIASRQLQRNFRKWAVPSYDPPLTLWGRLGRFLGKIVRNLRSNKLVD
jgi:hypothetical protein